MPGLKMTSIQGREQFALATALQMDYSALLMWVEA